MVNAKSLRLLCGLFSALAIGRAQEPSPPSEPAQENRYYLFAMYHYCFTLIFHGETLKDRVEIDYPQAIACYESYIHDHPKSSFVDDAKLRIAEIYNLSAGRAGERAQFPDIRFNNDWLPAANKWLIEVLMQHSGDKRFDSSSYRDLDEPPSALALWYLGVWNRNFGHLRRLLYEYPQSEPAGWVRAELRKAEQNPERKKAPDPKILP